MDVILIVTGLGSMLFVGYLAHERGRSQARWVWTAALIGPLAIPCFIWLTPRPRSAA
jgi:hypothetical protein